MRPDLPPDARVDVEWMSTSIFPVLGYALTSDRLAPWQLRQLAEYTLKPQLLRIDGVSRSRSRAGASGRSRSASTRRRSPAGT